ncbi:MAG: hypothetical protein ACXWKC_18375 [Xanthobacteraceae bacterium]
MRLKISLAIVLAASLAFSAVASAAPAQKKRKVPNHWHGAYGYLPGFSPKERRERAIARWNDERRGPYYIYGGPGYWSSFSRPGFYRGRWNGGGFGPCWTRTPIGMIWNCG